MRGRLLKALKSRRREKMPLAPQLCLQADKTGLFRRYQTDIKIKGKKHLYVMYIIFLARVVFYIHIYFRKSTLVMLNIRTLISNDMDHRKGS